MAYREENNADRFSVRHSGAPGMVRGAPVPTLTNEAVADLLPVLTQHENPLAELLSVVLNAAMRLERQEHLRAEPHERCAERNGRANAISLGAIASGFKERNLKRRGSVPPRESGSGSSFGEGAQGCSCGDVHSGSGDAASQRDPGGALWLRSLLGGGEQAIESSG